MLQRNLPMRQKQNHRHREQTGSCQRVGGWRKDRAEGWDLADISFFYIEWINNKVLLYSIVDYILYPVINHNGKEYEKEHTCVTESLCCTSETNTT